MKRFTINKLAKESGHTRATLSQWRDNGWLEPVCKVGSRFYYTLAALERAERKSLIILNHKSIINFNEIRRKYAL